MGSLTLRSAGRRPVVSASVAVLLSLGPVALLVVDDGLRSGPVLLASVGVLVLTLGVLSGFGALVTTYGVLTVLAVVAAGTGDDGPGAAVVAIALLAWLAAETAFTSLERRPEVRVTPAVRRARAADLTALGATAALTGVGALALSGRGPTGDLWLRVSGMAMVVVIVLGVYLLSRGRLGRRASPAPDPG